MDKVAIYVRSSKDLHDVSCETQEEQLRKTVKEKGEELFRVFCDKALSSTRDVRPDFDEMIALSTSKNPPFTKIYCNDTSRFGRDHYESQALLHQLRRKHGIDVIFTTMPNTGSYLDPAFEAIMGAFDYIHSQQSKAKGVASMKQIVRSGYRAGGRAPFGYRLDTTEVGKHKSGESIKRSKLVPDPDTALLATEYFERRSKGHTRKEILSDFHRRGIPSPTGRSSWPPATGKAMEDNVEVYLGHTVFNRHNERVKVRGHLDGYAGGKKWRTRDEWVITENTHEPLIGKEIADRLTEIKKRGIRDTPSHAKRVYALSGIMKCGICGTNYTGNRGMYGCNGKTKIGVACTNNDISQKRVEETIFSFIGNVVLNFENLKAVVERIVKRMKRGNSEMRPLERRLAQVKREKDRVLNLYRKEVITDADVERQIKPLNEHERTLTLELEKAKESEDAVEVSEGDLRAIVLNLSEEVSHADAQIKRRAVQTLLEEVKIFPKEGENEGRFLEIKGVSLPLTRVGLASPTGFEPVSPA